jgi:hypothetical protein
MTRPDGRKMRASAYSVIDERWREVKAHLERPMLSCGPSAKATW